MLCTASSHFVFDLCRRPFYGCARRLLFVHKETPGTRLDTNITIYLMIKLVTLGGIKRSNIIRELGDLQLYSSYKCYNKD